MAKKRSFSKKEIHYYGEGWYPFSANSSDLFVYLNTLELDNPGLKKSAEALLKVNQNVDDFGIEARFFSALEFLRQMAENERQKELNYLKEKFPNLDVSNLNYIKLIEKINEAILGQEKFLIRVQQEKERALIQKGKGSHNYTQVLGSYIEKALNQLTGQGQDENNKKDEDSLSMLVSRLLIRNINKTMSSLDLTELAAIVGITQTQIMPELVKLEKSGQLFQEKNKKKLSVRAVESAIKNSGAFKKIYKKEKENLSELKKISNHVLSKYGQLSSNNSDLDKAFEKISKANNYLSSLENKPNLNKTEIAIKRILKEQNKEPNIRFDLNFSPNTGMGQEVQIYEDLTDAILIGAQGGKIDISNREIGYFKFKYEKDKNKVKTIHEQVMSSIYSDTQKNFSRIGKEFSNAYEEIENILKRNIENLEETNKMFIFHHNVKDYFSTIKGDFSGFEGGVYHGLDLINSVEALSEVGFPTSDINWLKTCIINTSQYALGGSNKSNLENYLSIFASTLLFDDGLTIAQYATNNPFKSLNVLHLFPVNGIYVPSSYVMRTIYDQLRGLSLTKSKAKSSISTTIYPGTINFQEELNNLSSQRIFQQARWRAISNKQIEAMSIEIRFLGNFMDIINSFNI